MKVVMVEPGRKAQVIEIAEGLEPMQKAVGGYIQAIYPFDDEVALVCNEEGKIMGLPPNRVLYDDEGRIADIICGSFFICSAPSDSDRFHSLSEQQLETYYKMFENPDFDCMEYETEKINIESEKKKMKKYEVNYDYEENTTFAVNIACDVVELLNQGEYDDLDTAITEEVERRLIYYSDQWELIKAYQKPAEANYNEAVDMLYAELYGIIIETEIVEELDEPSDEER